MLELAFVLGLFAFCYPLVKMHDHAKTTIRKSTRRYR
jgi:hypothetical protein